MSALNLAVGDVVQAEHRKETFVFGGGEGGMVMTLPDGRVFGFQRPTNISTETKSTDVIWIRTDAGVEIEFRVEGDTFPCRATHRVGIVYLGKDVISARNLTTGKVVGYFNRARIEAAYAPIRTSGIPLLFAICSLMFIGGSVLIESIEQKAPKLYGIGYAVVAAGLGLAYFAYKSGRDFQDRSREAHQKAEQVISEIQNLERKLESEIAS